MNHDIKEVFERSKKGEYEAYLRLIEEMEKEVDWVYEVWDELLEQLTDKDNHQRSRAAQYLAYLAISDSEKRMLHDFPHVWKVTYDEKFVTARHTLQAIWRVGLAGDEQLEMLVGYFSDRFQDSTGKNYTLIRNDILQGMRYLYDHLGSENIKEMALEWIKAVEDEKYQKKYTKIWKDAK